MSFGAMDCEIKALEDALPKARVVVTGTLRADAFRQSIVDATVCAP
jgi:hypothetical protein